MIEQFAERLIENAKIKEISDIHIIPTQKGYNIFVRYIGQFIKFDTLDEEKANRLINYFKYISNMEVGEKRKPQTGSCVMVIRNNAIEIRTSTISNFEQRETIVIRLLNKNIKFDTNIPHYFPKEINKLQRLLLKKQGLVIFSGPVDSGKTTTIHKLLRKKYEACPIEILTLEDPVEIRDNRFLQVQVQEEIGIGYDELIKASLRHHPDILMIGEIRDEKTAHMAIRATLTGHLVVATIHSKSCIGVINRLMDLSISKSVLKETITGIVSQRLLPQYCPLCKGICHLNCTHIPMEYKRLALTDILQAEELQNYFDKNERIESFNHQLNKAYMYGFISKELLEEYWII